MPCLPCCRAGQGEKFWINFRAGQGRAKSGRAKSRAGRKKVPCDGLWFQSIDVILIDLVLDSDWQMNKYQLLSNEIQIQVGEWSEIFYFACSYSIDQIITYRRYPYFIIDRCFFCRCKNGFTSFQNFYITKYDHFVHFRCSMVSALAIRNPT